MRRTFPICLSHTKRDNNSATQRAALQLVSVNKLAVQLVATSVIMPWSLSKKRNEKGHVREDGGKTEKGLRAFLAAPPQIRGRQPHDASASAAARYAKPEKKARVASTGNQRYSSPVRETARDIGEAGGGRHSGTLDRRVEP